MTATQTLPTVPVLEPQFTIAANGTTPTTLIFSPTMRNNSITDGTGDQDNSREGQSTFVRGFKETLRFVTSDGNPWQWRRICWSYHGTGFDFAVQANGVARLPFAFDSSTGTGYRRLFSKIDGDSLSVTQITVRDALYQRIFKGVRDKDWSNAISAPTDPKSVKIWYDRTMTIQSPNEESKLLTVRRWHPINKTLMYAADDSGKGWLSSPFSEESRTSLGDYYIMDIFLSAPDDDGVVLSIGSDATYYWHER